jgi:hypothetical protein
VVVVASGGGGRCLWSLSLLVVVVVVLFVVDVIICNRYDINKYIIINLSVLKKSNMLLHSAGFRSGPFRGPFRSQFRNGSIPPE